MPCSLLTTWPPTRSEIWQFGYDSVLTGLAHADLSLDFIFDPPVICQPCTIASPLLGHEDPAIYPSAAASPARGTLRHSSRMLLTECMQASGHG